MAGGRVARRRRKGKSGKWVGRLLTALLALPALYLVAALIGSLVPVNSRWVEPAQGTTVYIADNGIHADLIMPVQAQGLDWAPLFPKGDFAAPPDGCALDCVRLGRGPSLSRYPDLVGHPAAHGLVGARRRQAGDARRICAKPLLCRARDPACGPRNIAASGPRSAPISYLTTTAQPQRIDHPGYGLPTTLSIVRPARRAQFVPATSSSRAGCASPE